jgi:hypothetical protein
MAIYSNEFRKEMEKRFAENAGLSSAKKKNNTLQELQALGRLKERQMNKLELAYSQHLEALKACGDVLWYEFEAVKLRLADNTHYTVDFMVMRASGELEAHEVKGGYAFDDSLVKLKCAAEKFPWPFYLVKKGKGGTWDISKVGNK